VLGFATLGEGVLKLDFGAFDEDGEGVEDGVAFAEEERSVLNFAALDGNKDDGLGVLVGVLVLSFAALDDSVNEMRMLKVENNLESALDGGMVGDAERVVEDAELSFGEGEYDGKLNFAALRDGLGFAAAVEEEAK
jgi:hypothetical protein